MFVPPIPLIRKKVIIRRLKEAGAVSINTAKTLKEVGIINPNAFSRINDRLVRKEILGRTKDNKYYIK